MNTSKKPPKAGEALQKAATVKRLKVLWHTIREAQLDACVATLNLALEDDPRHDQQRSMNAEYTDRVLDNLRQQAEDIRSDFPDLDLPAVPTLGRCLGLCSFDDKALAALCSEAPPSWRGRGFPHGQVDGDAAKFERLKAWCQEAAIEQPKADSQQPYIRRIGTWIIAFIKTAYTLTVEGIWRAEK